MLVFEFQFVEVLAEVCVKAARIFAAELGSPSVSRIQLVRTHFQGGGQHEDDEDGDEVLLLMMMMLQVKMGKMRTSKVRETSRSPRRKSARSPDSSGSQAHSSRRWSKIASN